VTHFTVTEIEEDPIERNKCMGSFTRFVNLLDLCAVAVPTGKWRIPKGNLLPFGITLIGQEGKDLEFMKLRENIVDHTSLHSEVV
jgi:Asp-tRNA(Asn)/Glu-tRNA(Gln) amidotransferase A subunit family amidase